MKRILSFLTIALGCTCISCNTTKTEGGLSAAAQKNLDAMHGVTHTFETKDFSKLGDFIAADAVDHAGEKGDVKGLENMKAAFEKEAAGMENSKAEVIKELADDEYAMSWMRFTGSYAKEEMGHKAGEKYDMRSLEVAKFKDGKATEHWTMMEPGEMMKMMGGMKPPMPGADSTKKM